MKAFEYHEAKDIPETLDLLASGEEVRILAGGCGILQMMKHKLYSPRALVNIKKITGLKFIGSENNKISIGTLSTHTEVKESAVILEKLPILAEALDHVATARIRNMATLGGTIVYADPNSDVAPALLVLESRIRVVSRKGGREIPMDSVYRDYFETVVEPTEIVESIMIPVPELPWGGIYTRFAVRKAMDKPMPGVAALVRLEDDKKTIRTARMAVSGVGNTPIRLKEEEEYVTGKEFHPRVADRICSMLKGKINPVAEYHYTTEYKREVAGIMLKRAVKEACLRAASRG